MKRFYAITLGLGLMALAGCATPPTLSELEVETIAVKLSGETQKGQYRLVKAEQLKAWMDANKPMLIVDTMPYADSYQKQHVPGAAQFELPIAELDKLDAATQTRLQNLLGPDRNRQLVFYCGYTKCGRSHNGAMWAVRLGYTNVYRFPGGVNAWIAAGYPVESAQPVASAKDTSCTAC
jgi:rhodanese-related sulfurtransferase